MRSLDLQGRRRRFPELLTAGRQGAAKRLRGLDGTLLQHHGAEAYGSPVLCSPIASPSKVWRAALGPPVNARSRRGAGSSAAC
jgi:hypothetical protein